MHKNSSNCIPTSISFEVWEIRVIEGGSYQENKGILFPFTFTPRYTFFEDFSKISSEL